MRFSCDAAPEGGSRVALRGSYGLFIGGSFVSGSSVFKTISPATEEVLAEVTHGTTEDVDRAVAAARQAYERVWSMMPGRERARYLLRIARLMRERAADLAVLESLDSGKPIRQTRDVDLPLATAHFFYHAGWADKLAYAGFGSAAAVPARPLGVVGQVIGWSSPLLMLAWKIAPALACGNTVVLKPAETTPLTALAFAEICADAGLPPGVVNIVTGDGLAGQLVAGHPGIDKVAFTGSPEVGREIAKSAALWGKRLTLELGGTSANIVCADADIDAAAQGIVEGVFVRQGHACCASSRVFVQESVLDDLVSRRQAPDVRAAVRRPARRGHRHRRGQLREPARQDHRARPLRLRRRARCAGRRRTRRPTAGSGFRRRCSPRCPRSTASAREELSWPVLTVSSFTTPDEVVERTNSSGTGCRPGSGRGRARSAPGWPPGCGPGWSG